MLVSIVEVEGLTSEWVKPTENAEAETTHLAAGSLGFQLQMHLMKHMMRQELTTM